MTSRDVDSLDVPQPYPTPSHATFGHLPLDLWVDVVSYLDIKTAMRCLAVSQCMKQALAVSSLCFHIDSTILKRNPNILQAIVQWFPAAVGVSFSGPSMKLNDTLLMESLMRLRKLQFLNVDMVTFASPRALHDVCVALPALKCVSMARCFQSQILLPVCQNLQSLHLADISLASLRATVSFPSTLRVLVLRNCELAPECCAAVRCCTRLVALFLTGSISKHGPVLFGGPPQPGDIDYIEPSTTTSGNFQATNQSISAVSPVIGLAHEINTELNIASPVNISHGSDGLLPVNISHGSDGLPVNISHGSDGLLSPSTSTAGGTFTTSGEVQECPVYLRSLDSLRVCELSFTHDVDVVRTQSIKRWRWDERRSWQFPCMCMCKPACPRDQHRPVTFSDAFDVGLDPICTRATCLHRYHEEFDRELDNLVWQGAAFACRASNAQRETHFHIAARTGACGTLQDLFKLLRYNRYTTTHEATASCDSKDAQGATPLFRAAEFGHGNVTRLLLACRASPTLKNSALETPMYIAALRGHTECVDVLLHVTLNRNLSSESKSGDQLCDVGMHNSFGAWTPLHAACVAGHVDVIATLVSHPLTAVTHSHINQHGQTPLHIAARVGLTAPVTLLLQAGADVHIRDAQRETPMSVALKAGKAAVVSLMRGAGSTSSR